MATKKKRMSPPSQATIEYRRLRRNIIARMRYREKQGFKVDYTTKPEIKSSATKRDVERLRNYKIGINSVGSVIADKPRSKAFVGTNFKGITPSQLYNSTTQEDTHASNVKEIGLDYVGMVWGKIEELHEKANTITYDDIGHEVNDIVLMDLMNAYDNLYRECCDIMYDNEMNYSEDYLNDYFKRPDVWSGIANEFARLIDYTPSNDKAVQEVGNALKVLLKAD